MLAIRETYREALGHHAAGRSSEADILCRRIVEAGPGHADAWHLLGLLAHEDGRHDAALTLVGRAVELHGANAAHYNTLGLAHAARDEPREAAEAFRLATLLAPDLAEAHSNLGAALRTLGDFPGAEAALGRALALKPDFVAARHLLGLVRQTLGRHEEAAGDFAAILRLDPNSAAARPLLAGSLHALGRTEEADAISGTPGVAEGEEDPLARVASLLTDGRAAEALEVCRTALRARPGWPDARGALGLCLLALGRPSDAEAEFRAVMAVAPGLLESHQQLGLALLAQDRTAEAVEVLDRLLAAAPHHAEASLALVRAHVLLHQHDQAEACLRRAIALRPGRADLLGRLAAMLADQGRLDEARATLRATFWTKPSDRLRVFLATLLPPILDSVDELEAGRAALARDLDRLGREGVRIEPTVGTTPLLFFLAHQGRNDRDIHRAFARLIAESEPVPLPPRSPAAGRKIRVGFFSVHFRSHTIGRLMRGVIERLPRESIEVVALSDARRDDEIGRAIAEGADEFIVIPQETRAARAAVAALGLDVLVYTDLGMDNMTYALACVRLAPIQCLTWGHPATSGLDSIDYFLSSDLLETPEADAHYTERLVRLPTLPIYYYRPQPPPPPVTRAAFGLPELGHVYGCPQTLFKFHPDFDPLLAAILRRDPAGLLVLIDGRQPRWRERLVARFRRTMPDVLDRVAFLPQLYHEDFLRLNACVDVLLDPTHFGGGNTTYEALALGTPVVTLPSPYLKGRITQALYRRMGVSTCIASDEESYVDLAVRLGTDAAWRAEVSAEILAASHRLFEDESALTALEEFFLRVARA